MAVTVEESLAYWSKRIAEETRVPRMPECLALVERPDGSWGLPEAVA